MRPRWCVAWMLAASLSAASASAQPGPQAPGPQGPGSQGPGSQGPGSQGPGSQGPGSQGPAGLLPDVMARLAQAPERRATFEEEKRLAALDQPLRSTGTLLYRRPRHLEKRTTHPAPESLVVDGDRLVLTVGDEPPRVVDLGGQPEVRALVDTVRGVLSGDLPTLQRLYGLQTEGTPSAWRLMLTPSDPRIARVVRVVRVEGAADVVRRIEVVEADGDTQVLRITPAP